MFTSINLEQNEFMLSLNTFKSSTLHPVYSEPAYNKRVPPHRSLIYSEIKYVYSEIKYVYSEYPVIVNHFCCTDPFTITGMKCITQYS
jgi:hypothetical protein